jgi:hypothetical protein
MSVRAVQLSGSVIPSLAACAVPARRRQPRRPMIRSEAARAEGARPSEPARKSCAARSGAFGRAGDPRRRPVGIRHGRQAAVLSACALAVRAPRPAARPALAFLQFLLVRRSRVFSRARVPGQARKSNEPESAVHSGSLWASGGIGDLGERTVDRQSASRAGLEVSITPVAKPPKERRQRVRT